MRQDNELAAMLNAAVGEPIERVKMACYLYQGHISLSDTPIQLEFADNSVVLLDGAGDGESLRVQREGWIDPFSGNLSDENKVYLEKHGQWVLIDVSMYTPLERLINSTFDSWRFVANQFGKICGVEMQIGYNVLYFVVDGDEGRLYWDGDREYLAKADYKVLDR